MPYAQFFRIFLASLGEKGQAVQLAEHPSGWAEIFQAHPIDVWRQAGWWWVKLQPSSPNESLTQGWMQAAAYRLPELLAPGPAPLAEKLLGGPWHSQMEHWPSQRSMA